MRRRRQARISGQASVIDAERWGLVEFLLLPGEERLTHTPMKMYNPHTSLSMDGTDGWDDGFIFVTDSKVLFARYEEDSVTAERLNVQAKAIPLEVLKRAGYRRPKLDLVWIDSDGQDAACRFSLYPSRISDALASELVAAVQNENYPGR